MQITVVSTLLTAPRARSSVRAATSVDPSATIHVLDVDGSYVPVGDEHVLTPHDVGVTGAELHARAVVLEVDRLGASLHPALVRTVIESAGEPQTTTVVAVTPGLLLLQPPADLLEAAARDGFCVVSRTARPCPVDGRWPGTEDVARHGSYAPELIVVHGRQTALLDLWELGTRSPDGPSDRWLEAAAAGLEHHTVRDAATLLSAWSLRPEHRLALSTNAGRADLLLDGRPVMALDTSGLDPHRPWLLDAAVPADPRGRLSDHPVLAETVGRLAVALRADESAGGPSTGTWDPETTSLGTPVDVPLRSLYRSIRSDDGTFEGAVPDPYEPSTKEALLAWLTDPATDGGPGRYLHAVRSSRPDLQRAFARVPGADTPAFLGWVRAYGAHEGYASLLLDESLSRLDAPAYTAHGRPPAGVNVIGYLRGELGIGESARLMVGALDAAGVAHTTIPVDQHLASRQGAASPVDEASEPTVYDTSLICVNADLTGAVATTVPEVLARSYRIGMWYWEVEDFPASQHDGFAHVDEVWVATDFVRRAIEPHAPVPVRTVTPPLPQRGAPPTITRQDLGLPERPLFLFSFDYLSTAERKNPLGLLDAFQAAFTPGEGPLLVIKSINADRRPSEAEQLRLRARGCPDVMLLENYLDADERDALVALCDVYVSLHRSEGLGLTMAEAMAWGKPVIATGYSGNLQFMTDENSFLVPWTPTPIPQGAEPYPAGGVWADPDLGAAAALMRTVIDEPDVAAARGARAAADIAALHSPQVAGARIAARLTETAARRRARSRMTVAARLHNAARQARTSFT